MSLVAAFGATFGARLVQLGLGLIASILIARSLGPAELGRFGLLWVVIFVATSLSDAGLTYSTVRLIARSRDRDVDQARLTAVAYARLRLAGGAITACVLFVTAEPVSRVLLGDVRLAPELAIAAWTLLALGISSYPSTVLIGLESFRRLAVAGILNGLIAVAGIAALAAWDALNLRTLVMWNVVLPVVSTLPAWVLLPRGWFPWRPLVEAGATSLRVVAGQILATSRWLAVAGVGTVIATQVDVLLLARFVDPVVLGVYVLALTLATRLDIVNQSVLTILLPRASRLEGRAAIGRYMRGTLVGTAVLAGLVVAVALVGQAVIVTAYGPAFAAAAPLFLGLLALVVFDLLTTALFLLAYPLERPRVLAVTEALRVAALVAAGLVLMPALGAVGAILARATSRVTAAAYAAIALRVAVVRSGPDDRADSTLATS